jgi:hypothetical protein
MPFRKAISRATLFKSNCNRFESDTNQALKEFGWDGEEGGSKVELSSREGDCATFQNKRVRELQLVLMELVADKLI